MTTRKRTGGRREAARFRARAFPQRAVDALVQNINSVIGGGSAGASEEEGQEALASSSMLDTTGYKQIGMNIKLRERVAIEDTVQLRDKFQALHENESSGGNRGGVTESLQRYLALPLEQYSVLNPEWITRLEDEEEGSFLLHVPLNDIVGECLFLFFSN